MFVFFILIFKEFLNGTLTGSPGVCPRVMVNAPDYGIAFREFELIAMGILSLLSLGFWFKLCPRVMVNALDYGIAFREFELIAMGILSLLSLGFWFKLV